MNILIDLFSWIMLLAVARLFLRWRGLIDI
jgi:hypothetical protein